MRAVHTCISCGIGIIFCCFIFLSFPWKNGAAHNLVKVSNAAISAAFFHRAHDCCPNAQSTVFYVLYRCHGMTFSACEPCDREQSQHHIFRLDCRMNKPARRSLARNAVPKHVRASRMSKSGVTMQQISRRPLAASRGPLRAMHGPEVRHVCANSARSLSRTLHIGHNRLVVSRIDVS
jgi:hypothetical protein